MKIILPHPYHMVSNSPWPIYVSLNLYLFIISLISLFNHIIFASFLFYFSSLALILSLFFWFRDITIEGTFIGSHTKVVQKGLMWGFILFLISEICLFATLFFSFFYNSIIPSIEFSSILPPIGILMVDAKALPLLNTVILFLSGISSTAALNSFISKKSKSFTLFLLFLTILLGLLFSYFQYLEYFTATFTISDSVFGSNLYLLTGFHGLHVILGIGLLIIATLRLYYNHFTNNHLLLFLFANIYWHFVDYIWIVLYIFLYCWAS